MKILSRQEFLALDEEVVFTSQAEGNEYIFSNLAIKGETLYDVQGLPIDFIYLDLICPIRSSNSTEWADLISAAHEDSLLSFDSDYETAARDGMYDEKEKYVVLEKSDLEKFIKRLQQVLGSCPGKCSKCGTSDIGLAYWNQDNNIYCEGCYEKS